MRLLLIVMLIASVSFGQDKKEVLNFANSKLNDSIPVVLSKQKLIELPGKPEKIVNWKTECALTEEQEAAKVKKVYYYGKTQFYIYDNKAELSFIDFRYGTFTYKTSKVRFTNEPRLYIQMYDEALKASCTVILNSTRHLIGNTQILSGVQDDRTIAASYI